MDSWKIFVSFDLLLSRKKFPSSIFLFSSFQIPSKRQRNLDYFKIGFLFPRKRAGRKQTLRANNNRATMIITGLIGLHVESRRRDNRSRRVPIGSSFRGGGGGRKERFRPRRRGKEPKGRRLMTGFVRLRVMSGLTLPPHHPLPPLLKNCPDDPNCGQRLFRVP